ncbi:ATP-dependent DNA helicase RecG [Candidatus Haliotispira prima]|uniref:ATP-dependent DNA helicase RecG n=1 Tax=Candidatus Haliotispira prima TaxID=3034016 RepID=A0ABY8MKY8_9SPIO|nr:ATP-dependent DNA helicase RecG [Candidatus Haliotispira prima]
MLLKDLRQNVAQLKGLGAKACQNLDRLHINHISDLLRHYPGRYLDHQEPVTLEQVCQKLQTGSEGESYCHCLVRVVEHSYIPWRGGYSAGMRRQDPHAGQALKVLIEDGSGVRASLLCFGRNFLASQLEPESEILVAGKFRLRYAELQCSSFVHEVVPDPDRPYKPALAAESGGYNGSEFGCILPFYPLTQGISQKQLRSAVAQALQHFSFSLEDELPKNLQDRHGLLSKKEALRHIHFPGGKELLGQAHRSLVYEELLILMLLIQRRRLQQHRELQNRPPAGFRLEKPDEGPGSLLQQAKACLPFALSEGQQSVLKDVLGSFTLDVPMNRLLQGDVGSGKTIVALLSALPWLETGAQVVLMAPTEILARQLQQNFEQLRESLEQYWQQGDGQNFMETEVRAGQSLGRSAFLSGSVSGAKRKEILHRLRSGELRLLVGTHALFSQAVEFANLRYIIVDEQHRFGVEQRLALKHKAPHPPHVLLMSATPIPRTLALTLYGDLDISSILSMPEQRKPITTHLVRLGNDEKMYHFIRQELEAGRQAYFICPLIGDSEDGESQLRNIEQMALELGQVFSRYRLGKVHGQMAQKEKDGVMDAFRAKETQILLATTVVEVGVDVPNASVIVVEHAERFGLAQLHQLRGRVGRGGDRGYCFLVYQDEVSDASGSDGTGGTGAKKGLTALAKERLLTLKSLSDGFAIAEKDLELRGPGDLLGAEQSGSAELHIAKIPEDLELLERARLDAVELLDADYALLQPANQGLRRVLIGMGQEILDA